jgi:peptidoglycan hydrolase CwlO-like protein
METLIVGALIKKELIAQTIGESTKGIFGGMSSILHDDFEFKNTIEELDIKSKIDIVNDLIKDIDEENINDCIHKALHYLHEIIDLINKEIEEINNDITEHKKLWFHRIRSANYPQKVQRLIKHNQLFDKRLDLLIKLLTIEK